MVTEDCTPILRVMKDDSTGIPVCCRLSPQKKVTQKSCQFSSRTRIHSSSYCRRLDKMAVQASKIKGHTTDIYHVKKDSRRSWFVCLGASLIGGISMGITNSFAVLYVSLLDEFNESKRKTALVGSLEYFCYFATCPLSYHLTRLFGFRRVVLMGSILFCLGLFLSSFVPNLDLLYVTYSLIFGIGKMLLFMPGIAVLLHCFKMHLATACGIVTASNMSFTVWVSPCYEYLIRMYGWRTTCKFLTVLLVPLGIACGLFPGKGEVSFQEGMVNSGGNFKISMKRFLRNKAFLVWLLMMYLVYLGAYVPLIHLVSFSKDISIATNVSVYSVSIMCVCDGVGKVCFGKCIDFFHWNVYTINSVVLLVLAVAVTLLPLANNAFHIFTFAVFYGFAFGVQSLMVIVVTPRLCHPEDSNQAVSYIFSALSIPGGIGPALAGWIYDTTHSYHLAFFIAGGLFAVASCLGFCPPLLVTQGDKDCVELDKISSTSVHNLYGISRKEDENILQCVSSV